MMLRHSNPPACFEKPLDKKVGLSQESSKCSKVINKKKRTHAQREEDSDYIPSDIETQLESKDNISKHSNKRQRVTFADNVVKANKDINFKEQNTLSSWIYNIGSSIQNAFGTPEQREKNQNNKRSCQIKQKTAAPLVNKTFTNER